MLQLFNCRVTGSKMPPFGDNLFRYIINILQCRLLLNLVDAAYIQVCSVQKLFRIGGKINAAMFRDVLDENLLQSALNDFL